MDTLSRRERSERMSLVRAKNTKPELRVRKLVYQLGYRYRLHSSDLPGHPELVFRSRRKIIFVHGCFWHQHRCRMGARMPKSRVKFWRAKLDGNKERDRRIMRRLRTVGWSVLVLWECQTQARDAAVLSRRLHKFLGRATRRTVSSVRPGG